MSIFTVIAILFVGSAARVAYVQGDGQVIKFEVMNSEAGWNELDRKLRAVLVSAPRKPLVCMSAAEGSLLNGVVFEKAVFDEGVRRFMYAQPKYVLDARAASLPTDDPATLLRACEQLFTTRKLQ